MNAVLSWLVQNTIAVALLIPIVLLGCRAFRTRPAVQHALWLVLLVRFLMPPLFDAPWSVESLIAKRTSAPDRVEASPAREFVPEPMSELIAVAPAVTETPIDVVPNSEPALSLGTIGETVVVVWGIGCLAALLVQFRRIRRHRALIRTGTPAPRHLDVEIGRIADRMGLRPIPVFVVPRIASPFVWCFGWLRLIWPETLLGGCDVDRSRGIIAHELAHVRRRDHWVAWMAFAAGLIWWWNPLFWLVRRRLHESAEWACDALALGTLPNERRAYAEMFLELSSNFKSGAPAPVLGMSTGAPSSFERRLSMILCDRISGKMSRRGLVLAVLLAGLAAPNSGLGQSGGGPSAPRLTDAERRLLSELRQKELAAERSEISAASNVGDPNKVEASNHGQLIVNYLRIPSEQQVELKIVVAEVNRKAAQSIGVNFAAARASGVVPGNKKDDVDFTAKINELKSQNQARIIASPNLIVLNGMPGNFRSGGEFPVPITTAGAATTERQGFTFVPYGVFLNVTPYITDKDRVRLNVNGSVSTLDKSPGAKVDGIRGPNLTDRTFSTTVELRDGQTLPIGGLIASDVQADGAKGPDTDDVPAQKARPGDIDISAPKGGKEFVVLITPKLLPPRQIANSKSAMERLIDPQNTLDLIEGRVRLVLLKEVPKRIQMGDNAVAVYNLVSPKEATFLGRATGNTVLNMWFVDEQGKETVRSHLVRVFPNPETQERLDRLCKGLERKVNSEFPNSVVHLRSVGDKVYITGQAYDSIEATNIIRFLRANTPIAESNDSLPAPPKDISIPPARGVAQSVTAANWSTPEQFPKSGSPKEDYRVITLAKIQATDIALALVQLFAGDKNKDLAIVAEPATNTLLVRGNAEQHEAIVAIVGRLEESVRRKGAAPQPAPAIPQLPRSVPIAK